MWFRIQTRQAFAMRRTIFGSFIFLLVIASSVSTSQLANRGTAVNVSVSAAGQDGPLQIVALRPPERGHGDSIDMLLRNTSRVATVDYWIAPLAIARDHFAPVWDHRNDHAAIRAAYGAIRPGSEAWTQGMPVLGVSTVMLATKDLRSTCLRITPVILEVHFADETEWKLDKIDDAMNRANQVGTDTSCPASQVSETDFDHLKVIEMGTTHHSDPADPNNRSLYRPVAPGGVQFFSFTCELRRFDGTRTALHCDE